VNDSIEELQIQVRELLERFRTREEDAAEERRQYVTSQAYMTLLNNKADIRSLLESWAASLRSGCKAAVGQKHKMVAISKFLPFNPSYVTPRAIRKYRPYRTTVSFRRYCTEI
jgi:hypothetical protein